MKIYKVLFKNEHKYLTAFIIIRKVKNESKYKIKWNFTNDVYDGEKIIKAGSEAEAIELFIKDKLYFNKEINIESISKIEL